MRQLIDFICHHLAGFPKKITALSLLICCCNITWGHKAILNIYNWSDYMPNDVINQFQRETGIHVNYAEYDSNEALYVKLTITPKTGFDIIFPSSYYIPRMTREGMLHEINASKIPNIRHLNPTLMSRDYDPSNRYSLPYTFGITGIAVNRHYHSLQDINDWQDLWSKQYRNQLLMLDDMRDVFSVALITLNYSINDTNPAHIEKAYQKLRQLMPNIKLFNSVASQNTYVDEDVTIGMAWNGYIFQAQQENSRVMFIYPKTRNLLWIDTVAIPKYAPHLENAYQFLNFINRPDIAATIARYNGYSSPNLTALRQLPEKIRNDPTFNPPATVIKQAVMENDLGAANQLYEKYWHLLKLGG